MKRRRMQALRNLAERPGTEAEGNLARDILSKYPATDSETPLPEEWIFPSAVWHADETLRREVKAESGVRFPRGTRAYYNYWAYTKNCPCTVLGPFKEWNWVRVKFDHLKSSRQIPIYSELGWHLSTDPIDDVTLRTSKLRGGMEHFEDLPSHRSTAV